MKQRTMLYPAVALILLFCSYQLIAQKSLTPVATVSRLSGTWIINTSESTSPVVPEKGSFWVISNSGDEIRITKHLVGKSGNTVSEMILFADERGESNVEFRENIPSKTKWKNNILTRTYVTNRTNSVVARMTDEYRLSKDGKQLIFEKRPTSGSATTFPDMLLFPRSAKLVFDRKN
jgi:hypothetical protein